jgi:hypothetical protein
MESEAFRRLTPKAVTVLLYMVKRHNGVNNGSIAFGIRSGCFIKNTGTGKLEDAPISLGRTAIGDALIELQAAGFIACESESVFVKATNYREGERFTREWRLTWLPVGEAQPTKDFVAGVPVPVPKRERPLSKIISSDRRRGQLSAKLTGGAVRSEGEQGEKPPICPEVRSALVESCPEVRSHLVTIPSTPTVSEAVRGSVLARGVERSPRTQRNDAPADLTATLAARLADRQSAKGSNT